MRSQCTDSVMGLHYVVMVVVVGHDARLWGCPA